MSPWPFVIAAYAVAAIGTCTLTLVSFVQMRKAERTAEGLKRR